MIDPKARSPYRFKYQKYMTNQEVINTITGNPAIYGDPNDKESKAYKIIKSLETCEDGKQGG